MQKTVSCKIRIMIDKGLGMGPGKAAMLKAIRETRSINAAGKQFGMSYRRAWLLVEEMNNLFEGPLVTARRGGVGGGGAEITRLGERVLQAYTDLENMVRKSVEFRTLSRMLQHARD